MGEIFKRPMPAANLPFTGERLTSELTGQTEIEHLHRYFLARHMCRGKDVLDVASGEGYGSALLAQVAKSVVGVELAEDVVAHANTEYGQPNVCFRQGDARELPIPDDFDRCGRILRHNRALRRARPLSLRDTSSPPPRRPPCDQHARPRSLLADWHAREPVPCPGDDQERILCPPWQTLRPRGFCAAATNDRISDAGVGRRRSVGAALLREARRPYRVLEWARPAAVRCWDSV